MNDDIDYSAPHEWETVENPWVLDHDVYEEDCWCSPTPGWCGCGALTLGKETSS